MPTSSKTARTILYVVLAFVILAGGSSAYAQWRAGQKDEQAAAEQAKSDELSRCIGGYRVRFVDAPAERSREAEKRVLELVALGEVETPAYLEAVDRFSRTSSNVSTFEDLNRLARLHPDAFLRKCRAENP